MMDLTPLFDAPLAVLFHVAFALPALVLGPVALFRKSRDGLHRWAGRVWVLSMAGLALSSFFITSIRMIGPFSPIHILSVMTLVGLIQGIRLVRAGQYQAHGRAMRALYAQALILAGVFTFLPGRRMNLVFFADAPDLGLPVAAAVGAVLMLLVLAFPRLSGLARPRLPFLRAG